MKSDLPEGWREVPLYDLADYINGRATKPTELVPDGAPVIKIAELTRGITDQTNRVRDSAVKDKHWVRGGDLLFAWSGSIGVHVYRGRRGALNQHIFRVVARDGVDQRFLRYLLLAQMPTFEGFVANKRTTMGHVTVADLKATTVLCPDLPEQQRIASVLGALDDKIESNRRLTDLIEDSAATIFQRIIGRYVDRPDVAIPSAWSKAHLSSVVDLNPKVPVRRGDEVPFLEMAALDGFVTRPTSIGVRKYSGGARFEPGDTLFARITPCTEHGKGAFVDFVDTYAAGSTEFIIMRAKDPLTPEGVFLLSRNQRFRERAISNMTGTSGRQRVPLSALADVVLGVPPSLAAWSGEAEAISRAFKHTCGLWRETSTLASVRDTLLPKLISGEVRVPDSKDPEDTLGTVVEDAGAA